VEGLRRRTDKPYRLPTESEWEYAARAGTTSRCSFGNDMTKLCESGRFADLSTDYAWRGGCRGDAIPAGSIQVGRLKPNPWGIFDIHGNVWEWVEDCWTPSASEIPTDGSAFTRLGNCELGVIRGGSWMWGTRRLRSAFRAWINTAFQYQNHSFLVALSLGD
jgi:formylglycine-generating enzyme required for sulfatase activity